VSEKNPAAQWLIAFALAALFAAFQIQSSLHSGSLSLPATYDDIGYFNDALARLEILYRDGGRAFLKSFWANAPHAPLQTLLALTGFSLLGPHQWAADAMNAFPLMILLRLVLGFAGRTLPLATSAAVAAALLGFPLLGLLVLEFRPDMLCALLTAAGALIVAADPRWRAGDRTTLATSTGLFVGALLTKPTLAPVTVAVFAVATAAVLVLQSKSRDDVKRIVRIAAIYGGIAALVVLPYYAAVFRRLYEYITVNAFGSNANIWAKNSATLDPAVYYLTGPGGKVAIGTPWLVLSGALLVATLPIWARSRAALAVLAVALVAYAGVTLPSMKSPFLGLIVPALLLGIVAILVVTLLGRLRRGAALAAALALVVFSVATWRPVSMRLFGASVPTTQAQHFTRIYDQTVDAIASIPDLGNRRLYFPVIGQYLNPDNVEFELRRRRLGVPAIEHLYFNADVVAHQAAIDRADLVVLFSDDSTLPLPWPASVTIRKEIAAAVAASQFVPVASVDGGPYPGRVLVLRRRP